MNTPNLKKHFTISLAVVFCLLFSSCIRFSQSQRRELSQVRVDPVVMEESAYQTPNATSSKSRTRHKKGKAVGDGLLHAGLQVSGEGGGFGLLLGAPLMAVGGLTKGASHISKKSSEHRHNKRFDFNSLTFSKIKRNSYTTPSVFHPRLTNQVRQDNFFATRIHPNANVAFKTKITSFQYVGTHKDSNGNQLFAVALKCTIELKSDASKRYFSGKYKGESTSSYTATAYKANPALVKAASRQAIDSMLKSFEKELSQRTK